MRFRLLVVQCCSAHTAKCRLACSPHHCPSHVPSSLRTRNIRITVVAADSLIKRDVVSTSSAFYSTPSPHADCNSILCQFQLPHPFAVVTVDGGQTFTTSAVKKTLNPYWNETFELLVILFTVCPLFYLSCSLLTVLSLCSTTLRHPFFP